MKLLSLTIKNFKGCILEAITFESKTTIARPNGAGKSTIAHAFFWLLDGKDADNSTARIKPEKDGEEIHNLITEVEGVFSFGTLRREMKEIWRKQKGEPLPKFAGNETTLFINSVETKQADWNTFLSELLPIKTIPQPWRAFSLPSYFLGYALKVAEKNAFLMGMANIPTDAEIASGIAPELLAFNLANIATEKQRLSNEIKREKDAISLIPGQITSTSGDIHRLKQLVLSETQKTDLEAELKAIDAAILDAERKASASVNTEAVKLAKELQSKLTEAQVRVNALNRKIQSEINNEIISEQKKATESNRTLHNLKDQLSNAARELSKARIKQNELSIKRAGLLSLFEAESKKTYDSQLQFTQCETCGQELPESFITKRKDHFEQNKKTAIQKIRIEGAQVKADIESNAKIVLRLEGTESELQSKVESFGLYPANTDESIRLEVFTKHTEESLRLNADVAAIELEIELSQAENNPEQQTSLDTERVGLNSKRDGVKKSLNEHEFNSNSLAEKTKALAELEAKLLQSNESIAEKELKKMLLDSFQKSKNEYISNSVNGLFSSLEFIFIQDYINGNDKEICECLVDGINYATTNTASRINAGVDFINSVSKFFGITMPIFVDSAESITNVLATDSQIILLKVKPTNN